MRILLIPYLSIKKEIRGDSAYLWFYDLGEYLTAHGHYCHMLLPETAREKAIRIPRLHYHFYKAGKGFYDMWIDPGFIQETFSRRGGRYIIDMAITNMAVYTPYLSWTLSDFFDVEVPIILYEFWPFWEGCEGMTTFFALQALGYLLSYPIFPSKEIYKAQLDIIRHYLAPSLVADIEYYARHIPFGVDCSRLDRIGQEVKKRDRFTLFYGGRINSAKHVDKILDLYELFARSGREIDIWVSTQTSSSTLTADSKQKMLKHRNIRLFADVGKYEFLKLAAQCHVFVVYGDVGGWSVGLWEQHYLGQVGIYQATPWVEAEMPGYELVFNNDDEAYTMLCDIYEKYSHYTTKAKAFSRLIKEKYSYEVIFPQLEYYFKEIIGKSEENRNTWGGVDGLTDSALELFSNAPVIHLDELIHTVSKLGCCFPEDNLRRAVTGRSATNASIYMYLKSLGYRDDYLTSIPRLYPPLPDEEEKED